jgi:ankyrin repeat protein
MEKPIPADDEIHGFLDAIRGGAVAAFEDYLGRYGAAIASAESSNGGIPLVWAASFGMKGMVERLLDAGAKVETKARGGWTPLLYAVANGKNDVVALLLDRGASPEAQDGLGNTAVMLAYKKEFPAVAAAIESFVARQQQAAEAELNMIKSRREQLKNLRPVRPSLKKLQPKL